MEIAYSSKFIRQYKRLSGDVKELLIKKEDLFRDDPFDERLKLHKLHGRFAGLFSFSINYEYRVVCDIENMKLVKFIAIGNHDIYEK